jgi:ribosome maturation factor RimP
LRDELLLKIRPLCVEHLERAGYVLVDMRFYRAEGGALMLEILADRAEGGINLDECAALNRALGALLEEKDLVGDRYTLDVSSPGLDRPLVTPQDFGRNKGREIRIFLRQPVGDRIEYQGHIAAVAADGLTLTTKTGNIVLPFDKVNKAKQVIL